MREYYIYRHIRLDKNVPFYIGKGYKDDDCLEYKRAYSTYQRSNLWNNIVNKSEFKVEIIFTTFCENDVNIKEKEFIKLYGRITHKNGTLANITDGGEGTPGRIVSIESREKYRLGNLGRKATEEQKQRRSEFTKKNKSMIEKLVKKNKTITSESFTPEHKAKLKAARAKQVITEETKKLWSINRSKKPILQFDFEGVLIKEWKSAAQINEVLGYDNSNIARACNLKTNVKRKRKPRSAYGFIWKYKTDCKNILKK